MAAAAVLAALSLTGLQSPGGAAGATATGPEATARPPMSFERLRRYRTATLGDHPDDAAAVAAYRAARLPRGTVGVAFVGRQQVAITGDGRVYDLPLRRAHVVRSGPGQRPPQRATVRRGP